MKNETNTQHTPGLDLSWENAKDGILVFYPHLTGGRPELIHKDAIEKHRQRCDEQTAGNVSAKYVPYLDAINASELLKENQELKAEIERRGDWIADEQGAKEKARALNAELLEASKALLGDVLNLLQKNDSIKLGTMGTIHIVMLQEAIAKAETKTLVGS